MNSPLKKIKNGIEDNDMSLVTEGYVDLTGEEVVCIATNEFVHRKFFMYNELLDQIIDTIHDFRNNIPEIDPEIENSLDSSENNKNNNTLNATRKGRLKKEEMEYLKKNADIFTVSELAAKLERKESIIEKYFSKNGIAHQENTVKDNIEEKEENSKTNNPKTFGDIIPEQPKRDLSKPYTQKTFVCAECSAEFKSDFRETFCKKCTEAKITGRVS